MILDILLLVLIAGVIAVAAAEGFVRAVIMAFGLYLLSLLLGMVVVALNVAQVMNDIVVGSIGGAERTPNFYQGLIFAGLLVPSFIGTIVLSHLALDSTAIRALRWFDNVLGTIVGVFVALAFAAVLCNAWGVIVSQRWEPYNTWITMRLAFDGSVLRPYMMAVLRTYRTLLFPFSYSGYPVFFVPQG